MARGKGAGEMSEQEAKPPEQRLDEGAGWGAGVSELLVNANALSIPLADESVDMCVTSPPYFGLRDYGNSAQLGLEETTEAYVANMVSVFREVWRVLKPTGTLWLNIGDSYFSDTKGTGGKSDKQDSNAGSRYESRSFQRTNGLKPKDLIGIPWMLAFALRADGWYLRSDIIWHKPNPMPESVTDRPTKAHEYLFLLSKSKSYYYDANAIMEKSTTFENRPSGVVRDREYGYDSKQKAMGRHKNIVGNMSTRGVTRTTEGLNLKTQAEKTKEFRNRRSVWTVTTKPYKGAHFATFPPALIEPCILAGSPVGGIVLDPFMGSGTTAWVARKHGRSAIGLDISFSYLHEQARVRLGKDKNMLL
jgi:DNA modification methylase